MGFNSYVDKNPSLFCKIMSWTIFWKNSMLYGPTVVFAFECIPNILRETVKKGFWTQIWQRGQLRRILVENSGKRQKRNYTIFQRYQILSKGYKNHHWSCLWCCVVDEIPYRSRLSFIDWDIEYLCEEPTIGQDMLGDCCMTPGYRICGSTNRSTSTPQLELRCKECGTSCIQTRTF